MRPMAGLGAALGVWLLAAAPASAETIDHGVWDRLLRRYVSEGLVDYHGLAAERPALEQYLTGLATVDVTKLSRAEQLGVWINAYNACVIDGVLEHYPLRSVKDVTGFFDRRRYRVAGRDRKSVV